MAKVPSSLLVEGAQKHIVDLTIRGERVLVVAPKGTTPEDVQKMLEAPPPSEVAPPTDVVSDLLQEAVYTVRASKPLLGVAPHRICRGRPR